jgi:hypothetical protein
MNPLKILTDLIHKLILYVNGLGQPKVKDHGIKTESISTIKVKEKQPEPISKPSWVTQEQPKQHTPNLATGYTTNVGNHGTSSVYGNASTSAYRNSNIKVGGKYYDRKTFQEVFPDDLKDLLNGGDNIVPTEMWQMDMKKKSIPSAHKIINKK